MRTRLLLICLSFLPMVAWAQQPQAWTPDTIQWQETNPDGTKYSVLQGRRDVPGEAFTYAFFIPAGYWEHHWHSADARVAVMKGELQIAYGPALDKVHAKGYGVGAYVLVPKNVQHTMGAKVDTIILGTAVGPWATHRHSDHKQ
jgi:quercetin dioxygenase-like cupin family protein